MDHKFATMQFIGGRGLTNFFYHQTLAESHHIFIMIMDTANRFFFLIGMAKFSRPYQSI
jgi:hypothetical protein